MPTPALDLTTSLRGDFRTIGKQHFHHILRASHKKPMVRCNRWFRGSEMLEFTNRRPKYREGVGRRSGTKKTSGQLL